MNHFAIRRAYPNVVTIDDGTGAFDADGNQITLDQSLVDAAAAELVTENAWSDLRTKRDQLLTSTDWEIVKHKELGTTVPAALKTYRQELRDLPANTSNPSNPIWPVRS
tara:strand:+ start:7609 stop:7935 length:327 start_codon:yes stop_codon:yes gene_type:complete